MSQKLINDIKTLQQQVKDLREEMIALRALVATKRRTKDMMEARSETH